MGLIPGSGRSPGEMATHSSILAWRIPWTEEPGELQWIKLERVRHNWSNLACTQPESSSRIKREATPPRDVKSNLTGRDRWTLACPAPPCPPKILHPMLILGALLSILFFSNIRRKPIFPYEMCLFGSSDTHCWPRNRVRCWGYQAKVLPASRWTYQEIGFWTVTDMYAGVCRTERRARAKPRDTYIFVTGWQA